MLGTSPYGYAKNVVAEVIGVGRAATLIDWGESGEERACTTMCATESILNWQVQRINGRNIPVLIVLAELVETLLGADASDCPGPSPASPDTPASSPRGNPSAQAVPPGPAPA